MPLINRCGGGSSFAAMIVVTYTAGGVCTCVNGSTTLTASDTSGNFTFKVRRKGTWMVKLAYAGLTSTEAVEITETDVCKHITIKVGNVYGIRRNVQGASPDWVRTDDAVGFTASASVGTVAGSSSFDSCYPWSGITRETLSTGDVMVKIPKFWYKRYVEGDYEYIKIADTKLPDFELHPAFNHANTPKDYVYVAAYKSRAGADTYTSLSGASLSNDNVDIVIARTKATAKGTGWGLFDFSTRSAIQMLFLIEYATNDSQKAIGEGAIYISDNAPVKTGSCDSVPNLTGVVANDSSTTKRDVVWRGIEGLWGNASEWIDGVLAVSSNNEYAKYLISSYLVCNDPAKYSDASEYVTLSYALSYVSSDYTYASPISRMGIDESYPYAMLPSVADGTFTTGYCDSISVSSPNTTLNICNVGMPAQTNPRAAGIFDLATYGTRSVRLLFIP